MANKLTKRFVDGLKAADKPKEYRDDEVRGLILRVQPSGLRAWYVERGRGVRRKLDQPYPVTTVEAAREQAMRMLASVDAWAAKAQGAPASLGHYIDDHYGPWVQEERRGGVRTAKRLKVAFADLLRRRIESIEPKDVDAWKARKLRAGLLPSTVNRDLTMLKSAFTTARAWGFLAENKVASTKRAKVDDDRRVRYLTADEERRLRTALAERDREMIEGRARTIAAKRAQHGELEPIPVDGFGDLITPLVLIAMNSGCRRGELTGLQWAEIDLIAKRMTVRAATSKGAKTRHVPLNFEAVDVLKRWKRQNPTGRVFPIQSPKKAWAALMTRAGLDDFRFHDCRHHFASKLVMAGVPLAVIRELLGHGSIAMTERYAHLAPQSMADAVALLNIKPKHRTKGVVAS